MRYSNYFNELRNHLSTLDVNDFGKWLVKNKVKPLGNPNDIIKQFRQDRGY